VYTIGPADQAAIKAALVLKENAEAQVSALSVGGPECEEVLRQCLAAGCDQALHLSIDGCLQNHTWDVTQSVANEVSRCAYDLVLCGIASLDEADGVFGPFLSELLGWPLVSSTLELSIDEKSGQLHALRLLDRGSRQRVVCRLPAVVSILEINPARRRPRRMAAPGSGLSAAQRMQLMMGRGEGLKPAAREKIFEGSVEASVERIMQYLQEQGLL
jgi:electron transfer flavoprotein beta subunit